MAIAKPTPPKPTAAQIAAFEALQAHAATAHPAPPTAAQIAALAAAHPGPTPAQIAAMLAAHPVQAHTDPHAAPALIGHLPPHHA